MVEFCSKILVSLVGTDVGAEAICHIVPLLEITHQNAVPGIFKAPDIAPPSNSLLHHGGFSRDDSAYGSRWCLLSLDHFSCRGRHCTRLGGSSFADKNTSSGLSCFGCLLTRAFSRAGADTDRRTFGCTGSRLLDGGIDASACDGVAPFFAIRDGICRQKVIHTGVI